MATPVQFQIHFHVFSNPHSSSSTSRRRRALTHQFIGLERRRSPAAASASKPQHQHQHQHQDENHDEPHVNDPGVKVALSLLRFYKTQISPFLPRSCRFVPTCSEYSMLAFKKYGLPKGFILTASRICRCNPFGGYGYDPPRWFGEEREEPSSSDL